MRLSSFSPAPLSSLLFMLTLTHRLWEEQTLRLAKTQINPILHYVPPSVHNLIFSRSSQYPFSSCPSNIHNRKQSARMIDAQLFAYSYIICSTQYWLIFVQHSPHHLMYGVGVTRENRLAKVGRSGRSRSVYE